MRRGEFGSAAEVPWRQLACRRRKPISEAAPLCCRSGLLCGGGLCGLILPRCGSSLGLFRGGSSLGLHLAFGSGRLFLSGRRALSFGTFSEVAALFVFNVRPQYLLCCLCMHSLLREETEREENDGWFKREYRAVVTLVITFLTLTQQLTGVKTIYAYGRTCQDLSSASLQQLRQ